LIERQRASNLDLDSNHTVVVIVIIAAFVEIVVTRLVLTIVVVTVATVAVVHGPLTLVDCVTTVETTATCVLAGTNDSNVVVDTTVPVADTTEVVVDVTIGISIKQPQAVDMADMALVPRSRMQININGRELETAKLPDRGLIRVSLLAASVLARRNLPACGREDDTVRVLLLLAIVVNTHVSLNIRRGRRFEDKSTRQRRSCGHPATILC
jgi:hypothetical protein